MTGNIMQYETEEEIARDWPIGTRVEMRGSDGFATFKNGIITGVIENYESSAYGWYVEIRRDDGKVGSGRNGTWKFLPYHTLTNELVLFRSDETTSSSSPPSNSKHRMGLDPEEIDLDAFKEFGDML